MIGKKLSHFEIVSKIGEGGMGVVYRAHDEKLGREVALKLLQHEYVGDEERRARFLREARTAAAVAHPNIATVHEINEVDDQIFIAMELVEGRTLKQVVEDGGMTTDQALRVAIAMADGLAHAHRSKIVHRDLKPENVILTDDGRVKILDFGLAKLHDSGGLADATSRMATLSAAVTREGKILGTVAYMSPEQARGIDVDVRSDVFSLGVVIYELVTGKAPFQGETITDVLTAILRDPQPPIKQFNEKVPLELERILARCLQKRPEDRYADAGEVLDDLRALKRMTDSHSQPIPLVTDSGIVPIPGQVRPRQRWGVLAAIAVVALAVGLSVPWLADRFGSAPDDDPGNALAVLPFANLQDQQDPDRLGQILQELIITDLSQVPTVQVYSSQRLQDVEKQIDREPDLASGRDMATAVAMNAGASLMMTGSLSQLGSRRILTYRLVDVEDGTVIKSERIDGDDLYAMVDDLTDTLRSDLGLAAMGAGSGERSVQELTSGSLSAYRKYLDGVEKLNGLDFQGAVVDLEQAVAEDPSFGRAYYKLAIAKWWAQSLMKEHVGESSEAPGEILTRLLEGDVKLTPKDRMLGEAVLAMVEMRYGEAVPLFEGVTQRFPDEKEAWYGLGEAQFHGAGGQTDQYDSIEAFERALELDPDFSLAYYHLVDMYEGQGKYEQSIDKVRALLAADPAQPSWYGRWAKLAMSHDGPEAVEPVLEAARSALSDPDDLRRVLREIASLYAGKKKVALADRTVQEALALDSEVDEIELRVTMGRIDVARGDSPAAERRFREALSIEPESYAAATALGELFAQERRYAELVKWSADQATGPHSSPMYITIWAQAAILKGDTEQIEASGRAVVDLLRDESIPMQYKERIVSMVRKAYHQTGDMNGAKRFSESLLDHSPDAVRTALEVGIAWNELEMGRSEEALDIFESMADDEVPVEVAADRLIGLSRALADVGRYDDAIARGEELIKAYPQAVAVRSFAVEAYLRAGRTADAERVITEGFACCPDKWRERILQRELVRPYMAVGDFATAEVMARKATAMDPDGEDPMIALNLAWVLLRQGQLYEAEEVLDAALEKHPGEAELDSAYALLEMLRGEAKSAAKRLMKGLATGPVAHRSHFLLAYALAALGRHDEALPHARKAAAMNGLPNSTTLLAWVLIDGDIDREQGVTLAERAAGRPEPYLAEATRMPFMVTPEECLERARE